MVEFIGWLAIFLCILSLTSIMPLIGVPIAIFIAIKYQPIFWAIPIIALIFFIFVISSARSSGSSRSSSSNYSYTEPKNNYSEKTYEHGESNTDEQSASNYGEALLAYGLVIIPICVLIYVIKENIN